MYLAKLMDEIRSQVPQEVKDLDQMMKLPDMEVDIKQLDAVRLKNGFKRSVDGRLFVRTPKNKWFAVKSDMYMPGYILLQDSQGLVYYLAPADVRDLQQVDLSDDMVVAMLFNSGEWAQAMRPLELEGENGKRPQQLKLSEADFRDLLSVLQEPEDTADEPGNGSNR